MSRSRRRSSRICRIDESSGSRFHDRCRRDGGRNDGRREIVRHGDAGVIIRSNFCNGGAWESVWCLTDTGLIDGCAGRDRGGITSGSDGTGILRFEIRTGGDGSRRCEEDGVQRRVIHGVVGCDEG